MPRKPKPPTHGGAREGAGRKPLDPAEKRTRLVNARFTDAEYARLELAAAAEGVTVTELVVRRALRA